MQYKCIGILGVFLGMLVFSLELYGLKMIEVIDTTHAISPIIYFSEDPCIKVAFIITICVIICSFVLYFRGKEICEEMRKNTEHEKENKR